MPNLGVMEILILAAILLLCFGPKRLPEVARGLGKGIRELKETLSLDQEATQKELTAAAEKVDIESAVASATKTAIRSRIPGGRFLGL